MRERCSVATHRSWTRYGGRGISVCDRWQQFDAFLADMGPRPSRKHSIERSNNNGHYEPDNCYWATRGEQARNRSSNRLVTVNGNRMNIVDAAPVVGISVYTLSKRLRDGWDEQTALAAKPCRGLSRHRR